MKKSELVEMIRQIVREETVNVLPSVLLEIMNSKPVVKATSKPQTVVRQPVKAKTERVYSTNPVLNKILNETQGGVPQQNDYRSLMNTEMIGKAGETVSIPSTDINGRPVDPAAVPEFLVEALTKDYSALLKATDKKAKANYRR